MKSIFRQALSSAEVRSDTRGNTVVITVNGKFDLSLSTALWSASYWHVQDFKCYEVVLADVTDLRDSGLAWLIMFERQLRTRNARLHICRAREDIACRCRLVGLSTV